MSSLDRPETAKTTASCAPPGTRRRRSDDDVRLLALRCELAQEIASAVLDVPVAQIRRASRSPEPVCHARHVAMYLAHVVFQVSLSAMAEAFGRDRTSCAHAVRRIEDRRDDADFEARLERLERLALFFDEALCLAGRLAALPERRA